MKKALRLWRKKTDKMFLFCSFSSLYSLEMQLLLKIDDHSELLVEVHKRLRRRFGDQTRLSKLDPVSQLVKSFIGARTRGAVSKAAHEALLKRFKTWEAVRDAQAHEIEKVIRNVTFADIKAQRLKAALIAISAENDGLTLDNLRSKTTKECLRWLERLPGVGRKIAASTLNASTLRKPSLVIDTHHMRVLCRLRLIDSNSTIETAYDRITPLLPGSWSANDIDEHHQLVKTLGQTICRHANPSCRNCPLCDLCQSGVRHKSSQSRRQAFVKPKNNNATKGNAYR